MFLGAIGTLIVLMLGAVSAQGAALALVLAIDVPASVTPGSYLLQRDGIARAFPKPASPLQIFSLRMLARLGIVLRFSDIRATST